MVADLDEMENMISTTLAFARDESNSEPLRDLDLLALVQRVCDDMAEAGLCHINWGGREVRPALGWPDAPALFQALPLST